jgi:hypothetical protein
MPGSAGGLDGLRPQHLKDLTGALAGDAGRRLLAIRTEFVNICLSGRVPEVIQPVFCGASLCALNKKDGGIRTIAVGGILRRLVAKLSVSICTANVHIGEVITVSVSFNLIYCKKLSSLKLVCYGQPSLKNSKNHRILSNQ